MFYNLTLPKSSSSPAAARELLDQVRDQLTEERLDDARLLVSELVANSVEHVREEGDIEVRLELQDSTLRVDVLDPGPGFTYAPEPGEDDRGWGLVFVDRVARRWANERGRVWFELDRS